jgi:thiamine-phosphate diphosphorylase
LCHARGCRVIVNDRVDLCLLSGADGVHLGQDDLPPSEARRLLGPGKIIGISTHTMEQFGEARDSPADYLALGPVFPTGSKADPSPLVQVGIQEAALKAAPLPVVAIGGITPLNAGELWARGFASLAVIGALARDPGPSWREFLAHAPRPHPSGNGPGTGAVS